MRQGRCPDTHSPGGPNKAQVAPAFNEDGYRVAPFIGIAGSIFNQQGHGHVKGAHAGFMGNLKAQGLQDLRDDHRCPHLLLDDRHLGRPQQAQVKMLLD